jgi:hypothetical protein
MIDVNKIILQIKAWEKTSNYKLGIIVYVEIMGDNSRKHPNTIILILLK